MGWEGIQRNDFLAYFGVEVGCILNRLNIKYEETG